MVSLVSIAVIEAAPVGIMQARGVATVTVAIEVSKY